jgi:hypothetical protein
MKKAEQKKNLARQNVQRRAVETRLCAGGVCVLLRIDSMDDQSSSWAVSVLSGGDDERRGRFLIGALSFCCDEDCIRPFAPGGAMADVREVQQHRYSFLLLFRGCSMMQGRDAHVLAV